VNELLQLTNLSTYHTNKTGDCLMAHSIHSFVVFIHYITHHLFIYLKTWFGYPVTHLYGKSAVIFS